MKKFSFIAKMPDEPGALHKAAEIAKHHHGNIHRIHYNRRIDSNTVFFDITASPEMYEKIKTDLHEIGYLQTSLKPISFLKFNVYLPNKVGALFEFLEYLTSFNANVGFMDFDDSSTSPDKLTVSLTLKESSLVNDLLNSLKSQYRLEILEYDEKYENLDDTVFYIIFAQKIRDLIGSTADEFLIKLLSDINHIVQELTKLGEEPREVFDSILLTGKTLKESTGKNFFADVQKIHIKDDFDIFCFQPPCGGNIFILNTSYQIFMIDTGYGIYHHDVLRMLQNYGLGDLGKLKKIYITHADADHSGAGGLFTAKSIMHERTLEAIKEANRAYGSTSQSSVLEEVYTKLINLFSEFHSPENVECFKDKVYGMRNIFPVIDKFKINDLEFEVLESLGGHLPGQIFIICPEEGLLFTGDSLINFESLSTERKEFNLLAKTLMTSVNVDTEAAAKERDALMQLASELDKDLSIKNRRCFIFGGHGTISQLSGDKLETIGEIENYKPDN